MPGTWSWVWMQVRMRSSPDLCMECWIVRLAYGLNRRELLLRCTTIGDMMLVVKIIDSTKIV